MTSPFLLMIAIASILCVCEGTRCHHIRDCFCRDSSTIQCSGDKPIDISTLLNALPTSENVKSIDIRGRIIYTRLISEVNNYFTGLELLDIRNCGCTADLQIAVDKHYKFEIWSDCQLRTTITSTPKVSTVENNNITITFSWTVNAKTLEMDTTELEKSSKMETIVTDSSTITPTDQNQTTTMTTSYITPDWNAIVIDNVIKTRDLLYIVIVMSIITLTWLIFCLTKLVNFVLLKCCKWNCKNITFCKKFHKNSDEDIEMSDVIRRTNNLAIFDTVEEIKWSSSEDDVNVDTQVCAGVINEEDVTVEKCDRSDSVSDLFKFSKHPVEKL